MGASGLRATGLAWAHASPLLLPVVEEAGYVTPAGIVHGSASASAPQPGSRARILAVDDDPQALRFLRDVVVRSGFQPIVASDPEDALRLMVEEKPYLVLLDLMFPRMDGMDLMGQMRSLADVPVIFVSAYGQDHLVAKAFELGADDYVVKPFSATELAARIGAALRRRHDPEPLAPYVLGDLIINYRERLVTLAGNPVRLTAKEYRLLAELAANTGRTLHYGHLLARVWDQWGSGDLRPMRTAVRSLRRKLGDDTDNPRYIFTEPRVGYRMAPADESDRGDCW